MGPKKVKTFLSHIESGVKS